MKDEVEIILRSIDNELQNTSIGNNGLMSGTAGVALFYNELYNFTNDEQHLDVCFDLVTKSVDRLTGKDMPYSFCHGFAGVLWVVDRFMKSGVIEKSNDLFDSIEPELYRVARLELEKGNYDFLHGTGGVALLALSRLPGKEAQDYLEDFVLRLDSIKEQDRFGFKWRDLITEKNHDFPIYGLGMAHGVPSIVMLLLKIFHKGIARNRISELVEQTISWILSNKLEKGKAKSMYPNKVVGEGSDGPSRLSWCYGDLSLAIMFHYAGKTFNNELWTQESNDLIQHSLNRRDSLNDATLDAAVCHGTAGIAFLFKLLGMITVDENCHQTHQFWISETLKLAKKEHPPIYKFYYPKQEDIWVERAGILEGTAGVGLVLLDYLNGPHKSSILKEAFLLDS